MRPGQSSRHKIIIPLGFTPILTLVVLLITFLVAAYVAGVMSGRHWFMPDSPASPEPVSVPLSQPPAETILKPGELDFAHVLKGQSKPVIRSESMVPKAVPPVAPPVETADTADAPPVEEQKPVEAVPTSRILNDYVFQVAALKDEKSVDSLRQQLEGAGLRTRMERKGKLLLVLVLLRGDETRAAEAVATARSLKLGEPLLLVKKPVTP